MRKLIVSSLTLGVAAFAANAGAVTVQMFGHTGTNANSAFLVNYNGSTKFISVGTPMNVKIDTNPTIAYCVDLDRAAALNTTYQATTHSAMALWGANGGRLGYIYQTYTKAPGIDIDHQIAAQVAMWEARYDTNLDLDSGIFRQVNLNATVKGYAQTILNDLSTNPSAYIDACVYRSVNEAQDILADEPVPEPASLAALGLGAFGLLRRRRNKK